MPQFCIILDPKIIHSKKIFDQYFCVIFAIVIQAWHLKVKTITLLHKIACISEEQIPKTYIRNARELFE
jgi:hypothetical protein